MGSPLSKTLDAIEDTHLRGIGLVALSWAYMEGAAERIVWRMARLDDNQGAALTTHMGYIQRLHAANTLIDNEFPDSWENKNLRPLIEKIRNTLSAKRNEIVHSRIVQFNEPFPDTIRMVYKARGKLQKKPKSIRLPEYEETSREILLAGDELREILSSLIHRIDEKSAQLPNTTDPR